MRVKTILIVLVIFSFWSFVFQPTPASKQTPASSGEDQYNNYCKSCHGKTGKGFFKIYPPLSDKKFLDNDSLMVAIITQGLKGPIEVSGKTYDREMPAVEGISNAEIASVVNYIRKEFIDSSQKLSAQKVKALRENGGSWKAHFSFLA